MPVLEKTSWEDFARNLARGMVQEDAYEQAGFAKHRGAASRLANNPMILERVAEIKAERNELLSGPTVFDETQENDHGDHLIAVNKDWVIQQLAKIALTAQQMGNHKDSIKALEMLGQHIGLSFADKTQKAQDNSNGPGLGQGNTFNIQMLSDQLGRHMDQIESMKNITPPVEAPDAS